MWFIILPVVAVLSLLLSLILPWWVFAAIALVVSAAIAKSLWHALIGCSVGVFILWVTICFMGGANPEAAVSVLKFAPDNIISIELVKIFGHTAVSYLLISLVGAIVGGVAGMAGYYIRDMADMEGNNFKPI